MYAGKVVSLPDEWCREHSGKPLKDMEIDCTYSLPVADGWSVEGLRALLCGARKAVVIAHTNADGDAVGSLTGMDAVLRRNTAAVVTPMLPDGCPEDLLWLPNTDRIVDCSADPQRARRAVDEADLIVAIDLNGFDRTGAMCDTLLASKARKVLIDHHIGPQVQQFDIVVSDDGISSACEMAYWAMRLCFGADCFDQNAATSLFTGICTDTGTFSYSNTRQSVYLAAAELLRFGIDPMDINRRIKNVFTTRRLQFFGFAMSQRLTVYDDKQLALMVISRDDVERYGVTSAELTGLVNEVMKLRDVDCAVLVREEADKVRLSFRSKEHTDVNLAARELFEGGGHQRAAGATSHLPLAETVARVKAKFNLQ